ncbi:MAG: hypothetical protein HY393_03125 [Candidatus Diapherotrites archaeon]|nr:hypothetical protein [Candidatus Diapherotrites archaeon]
MGPALLARLRLFGGIFLFLVLAWAPQVWAVACSDLVIQPDLVFGNESSTFTQNMTIQNNSPVNFNIMDVNGTEFSDYFSFSKGSFSTSIPGNGSINVPLAFSFGSVTQNQTDFLYVQVDGNFSDSNLHCGFQQVNKAIQVTVKETSSLCSQLDFDLENVSLNENTSIEETFTLSNPTGFDFNVSEIEVLESASELSVSLTEFDSDLEAEDEIDFTVELNALNANQTVSVPVFVHALGTFENGTTCGLSAAQDSFNVTVNNTVSSALCPGMEVQIHTLEVPQNGSALDALTVLNKGSVNFYVDEIQIQDANLSLDIHELDWDSFIPFGEAGTINVSMEGFSAPIFDGNASFTLQGHFTNNASCQIVKKIPFTLKAFAGFEGSTCSDIVVKTDAFKILGSEKELEVFVNNPLNEQGTLNIESTNAYAVPSTIPINPLSTFKQSVHVEPLNESQTSAEVEIKAQIGACPLQSSASKLFFSGTINHPLEFIEVPSAVDAANVQSFRVALRNKTSQGVSAKVSVVFSDSTWSAASLNAPFNAFETRILEIAFFPGTGGSTTAQVQVEANGEVKTKTLQFLSPALPPVDIQSSVQPSSAADHYDIVVVVTNNTNQSVDGTLVIPLPPPWTVQGNTNVHVKAHGIELRALTLMPGAPVVSEVPLAVQFVPKKGIPSTSIVALKPIASGPLTAFVFVGNTAFWGLIVLLLLALVWVSLEVGKKPEPQEAWAQGLVSPPSEKKV